MIAFACKLGGFGLSGVRNTANCIINIWTEKVQIVNFFRLFPFHDILCGLRHQHGGQASVRKAWIGPQSGLSLSGVSEHHLFPLEAAEESHHLGVVGRAQHRQEAVVPLQHLTGNGVGLVMLGADAVDLLDEGAGAVHEGKGGILLGKAAQKDFGLLGHAVGTDEDLHRGVGRGLGGQAGQVVHSDHRNASRLQAAVVVLVVDEATQGKDALTGQAGGHLGLHGLGGTGYAEAEAGVFGNGDFGHISHPARRPARRGSLPRAGTRRGHRGYSSSPRG